MVVALYRLFMKYYNHSKRAMGCIQQTLRQGGHRLIVLIHEILYGMLYYSIPGDGLYSWNTLLFATDDEMMVVGICIHEILYILFGRAIDCIYEII